MREDTRRWFERRTSSASDWPVEFLVARKGTTRVSVVLPALDEEPTVGEIVAGVRALADRTGLVDEVLVIDSGSVDRTAAVAASAGARVVHRDDVLPGHGSRPGKGEVLWKALDVTAGDLLVYVDADLTDFAERFVTGLLGPLLTDGTVLMVKAFYDRTVLDGSAAGGGRVTELMARPLLNAYLPELAGVVEPLSGEYAARRSLLERLPFAAGYGVETGLLIDTVIRHGLDAVAQVDLGERDHRHRNMAALGRMSAEILHTVLRRMAPGFEPEPALTQFRRAPGGGVVPVVGEVSGPDRPPMITIPEYSVRT